MNRRSFMARGAGSLLGLAGGGMLWRSRAQEANPLRDMITPNAQRAIDLSLAWLAQQQHQDGSFGTGGYHGNVAITSLGGLAFMSGGYQPNRGRYGDTVTRALRYILGQADQTGFINSVRGAFQGPMYGHGFATLFLAEVYGMVNDPVLRTQLRDVLGRAVRLILSAQNGEGGWRYHPRPADADLSVTICQIMALRAARNVGIAVPERAAANCTNYVKRCQEMGGGFRYQPFAGGAGFARTAAGVVALNHAGIYLQSPRDSDLVRKGLDYLKRFRPGGGGAFFNDLQNHYYYGHYYAVQAMWIAGPEYFRDWYPAIRDDLLNNRRNDGSWSQSLCAHYATAMALIILQVPNNYLPILTR